MADPYGLELSGLTPELSAEAAALARRQKVAEAMGLQAQQALPVNRMAGRMAVPISPFEGAAQLLRAYSSGKALDDVDAKRQDIARRGREAVANEVARIQGIEQGSPGQVFQPATPNDDEGNPIPSAQGPAIPGDPQRAVREAMLSQLPQANRYGQVIQGSIDKRDAQKAQIEQRQWETTQRAQDRLAQIEAQAREGRITREEADKRTKELRLEMQANQIASARELRVLTGAIAAGNRQAQSNKPPPGYRWTPNGDQEVIPGGPADVKANAIAQRQADGASDVDVALGTLRDAYNRLEKGGGITSTNKDATSNALASIQSSGVGQAAGKLFGTNNQSARNDIAMARPALLAALMKATGMSAKQMDSNAELKLWLSTATDPTLDVQSNRKALENIEKKYMKGGSRPPPPPGNTGGASESFGGGTPPPAGAPPQRRVVDW